MSKLVEQGVAGQFNDHVRSNQLDNLLQSAYQSGHFLYIKNEVHLSLAHGEPAAVILCDLSMALDSIDHSTFLNCLTPWFGVWNSIAVIYLLSD